jgi:hypothetical protein
VWCISLSVASTGALLGFSRPSERVTRQDRATEAIVDF